MRNRVPPHGHPRGNQILTSSNDRPEHHAAREHVCIRAGPSGKPRLSLSRVVHGEALGSLL